MRHRIHAALMFACFCGAVLFPLSYVEYQDSFPLSPYTMFARRRATKQTLHYAIATEGAAIDVGERFYISPKFMGSSEVLQAQATLTAAVRSGRQAQEALCKKIGAQLHSSASAFRFIHLVRGTHNSLQFLAEGKRGTEKKILSCPIAPGKAS